MFSSDLLFLLQVILTGMEAILNANKKLNGVYDKKIQVRSYNIPSSLSLSLSLDV